MFIHSSIITVFSYSNHKQLLFLVYKQSVYRGLQKNDSLAHFKIKFKCCSSEIKKKTKTVEASNRRKTEVGKGNHNMGCYLEKYFFRRK